MLATEGAILNGQLRLSFAAGFVPTIISSYAFLTAPSAGPFTVNFTSVEFPPPPPDGKVFLRSTPTTLRLFVSSAADFNNDGVVNNLDYQGFVNAFGSGSGIADFNGDGIVDLFDYLDFVRIYARR